VPGFVFVNLFTLPVAHVVTEGLSFAHPPRCWCPMLRSVLVLASLAPSLALAVACPATPTAPLPASLPVPEMATPAPTPARDCGPGTATAWVQRLRQPAQPVVPATPAPAPQTAADGYVPKTAASVANPNDPGAYKPQTEFDNTPWRFDMNQNGRRMTAEEFDAWMKAKGIRVATGKPAAAAPAESTAAAEKAGE
jgi:hypothetical protein